MKKRPDQKRSRIWAILRLAANKFFLIDGGQWAGAFAFNAFFSLFPLMILIVTIASFSVDQTSAGKDVVAYIEGYVPLSGEMQRYIFDTVAGVINAREQAGVVALLLLLWTAVQCFTTLICATNNAWGTEVSNWWRLPMKSLALLGIMVGAILLGITAPVLMRTAKSLIFPLFDFHSWMYWMGSFFVPSVVVFFGLSMFYMLAPRRSRRFAEVWVAALFVTILLRANETLFVIYLKDFATFNAVYGAFGGIMALLLWIYISGYFFIFGACLSASQTEVRSGPAKTTAPQKDKGGEV
jgi:YihY family inner membrane protein